MAVPQRRAEAKSEKARSLSAVNMVFAACLALAAIVTLSWVLALGWIAYVLAGYVFG